jgi:hypothetical protein
MNGLNYGLPIITFGNVASVTRYAMTSEELADQVTRCVESLRSRIMGTGDEQYSRGTEQSIETKSGEQIVLETLEELDDAIVYLAHLRARLGKLAQL